MAYVHVDNVHVYGTQFRFLNVNQFRPASALVNGRNWVDWSFGAGSQVLEQASDLTNPQPIDGNLKEMSLEYSETTQSYATGTTPTHQAVGDLNGDGWKDIIVSLYGTTLSVYMSDTKGGFLPARNYTVNAFQWWTEAVTSADFNRDGRDDVAIISRDQET